MSIHAPVKSHVQSRLQEEDGDALGVDVEMVTRMRPIPSCTLQTFTVPNLMLCVCHHNLKK